MFRQILLVFEHTAASEAAVSYTIGFARRMDAPVTLLVLSPMDFGRTAYLASRRSDLRRIEEQAGSFLSQCTKRFVQQGIEVHSALRVGEPGQELVKYLADRPPFQVLIWGGGEDLPPKAHWLHRVADTLECPLVSVNPKRDSQPR